jgi:tetratricopeptide (TPR) repeat protein
LRRLPSVDTPETQRWRARLTALRALVRQGQERPREALRLAERAVREAEQAVELRALAQAYGVIDWAHITLGYPKRAIYGLRALALYEKLDDIGAQAVVTNNLGAQAYFDGRWTDAVEFYSRSRSAALRVGDAVHAAMAAMNLGEVLVNQGRLDEAEPMLTEASRVLRASSSDASEFADMQLGRLAMERGRYDEAEAQLRRVHEEALAAGRRDSALETGIHLADCRLRSGRAEDAVDTLHMARREAHDASALWVAQLAPVEARALAAIGRFDDARAACRAGREEAHQQGLVFALALVLVAEVEVEILAGRRPQDPVVAAARAEAAALFDRLGCSGRIPADLPQTASPEPA